MTDILNQLAAHARERVAAAEQKLSKEALQDRAFSLPADTSRQTGFPFERTLSRADGDIAFLCECKKASPSKGLIAPEFPYLQIAEEYAAAGADAVSVLTEPKWFLGSDTYLQEIAARISLPCLRKDFTVDDYMIYEAKVLGASAVLLICSLLDDGTLRSYMDTAQRLGLSVLTEAHDETEVRRAIRAGARIIGVNNRNLRDFTVSMENSQRLRSLVPPDILFVAESGIFTPEDVNAMRRIGANAVLVGEALMRAPDKTAALRKLKGV
jgi:indole-3-glycerol phosphate synthase